MCEPLTIALMAASAGVSALGGGMTAAAQNAQIKQTNQFQQMMMARNRALREEEFRRQDAMRKQQEGFLDKTIDLYRPEQRTEQLTNSEKRIMDTTAAIQADMAAEEAAVPSLIAKATSGNTIATNDMAKRLALATKESKAKIAAMAKAGSYDLAAADRAMASDVNAEGINRFGNYRQGSLKTAETELGLNNSVASSTTIAPQTNLLAAGAFTSGIGQLIGSAAAGGGPQKYAQSKGWIS